MKPDIVTERFAALPEKIRELYHTDCLVHAAVWRYLRNEYTIAEMFTALVVVMSKQVRDLTDMAIRKETVIAEPFFSRPIHPPSKKPDDAITVEKLMDLRKQQDGPGPLTIQLMGMAEQHFKLFKRMDIFNDPYKEASQ